MQPPSEPPPSAQRWVPFAEAQRVLGLSETTLRRMIRQGKVTAESQPRAEGDPRVVYRVLVTDPPNDPPPPTVIRQDSESEQPPDIRQEPPPETAMLLDRLEAAHERERAQADRIAALERENGRLESTATHAQQLAEIERERRVQAEALAAERGRELERERARSLWKPWTW